MSLNIYYDKDTDLGQIQNKAITILGYGSQGHAHALNLKDSGVANITIGLRSGSSSADRAQQAGFTVKEPVDAVQGADIVMILVPDEYQEALYQDVESHIKEGAALAFAHGLNIHFNLIQPRKD